MSPHEDRNPHHCPLPGFAPRSDRCDAVASAFLELDRIAVWHRGDRPFWSIVVVLHRRLRHRGDQLGVSFTNFSPAKLGRFEEGWRSDCVPCQSRSFQNARLPVPTAADQGGLQILSAPRALCR